MFIMKVINRTLISILTVCSLASSLAHAKSGSRLCGVISVNGPIKIGLLYQTRQKDASTNKQCEGAIEFAIKNIESNTELKAMQWENVFQKVCDDIGKKGFVSNGQSPDICDSMDNKTLYKITKQGEGKAIYEKIK
jgi:hypothetical protein